MVKLCRDIEHRGSGVIMLLVPDGSLSVEAQQTIVMVCAQLDLNVLGDDEADENHEGGVEKLVAELKGSFRFCADLTPYQSGVLAYNEVSRGVFILLSLLRLLSQLMLCNRVGGFVQRKAG